MCSVWSFQTDPSYEAVTFPEPTVVAYWPKRMAPVTAVDVAMGKPVSTGGTYTGYSPADMLTAGTTCYNTMEDCFCTVDEDNWVMVDLQASLPVRTVVLTGPAFGDVLYFRNVVVRAGNTGGATDPIIGKTPSTAATDYKTYTLTSE
ncbi:uncharacterized protein LOC108667973 [Hyalella azteca]|uniref:Uncharacterized protein LOC108667973 n=1 Tax=Hyalella azteca TaxID=294128 RepID=A0A979FV12_HYAAZ|nr:uncharacterized protein LOC108667973 [Hyalella azteca]